MASSATHLGSPLENQGLIPLCAPFPPAADGATARLGFSLDASSRLGAGNIEVPGVFLTVGDWTKVQWPAWTNSCRNFPGRSLWQEPKQSCQRQCGSLRSSVLPNPPFPPFIKGGQRGDFSKGGNRGISSNAAAIVQPCVSSDVCKTIEAKGAKSQHRKESGSWNDRSSS